MADISFLQSGSLCNVVSTAVVPATVADEILKHRKLYEYFLMIDLLNFHLGYYEIAKVENF